MSQQIQLQARLFALCCGFAAATFFSTQTAEAAIILTPGAGATGVTSTGLDTTTGPARPSIAPTFDAPFSLISKGLISVSSTSDLGPNYIDQYLNDDTGYSFLVDNASNRGWIPATNGIETATFTFAQPQHLSGIDFLTLFTNRTSGTFRFDYSVNNGGTWAEIATVSNNVASDVFRQGFSFDGIVDVTDVRLVTDAAASQIYIGEVNFFSTPGPIPEPSTGVLLLAGLVLARRRQRNKSHAKSQA